MSEDRLLDVSEVASLLGVSARGVWRWRDAGSIPAPVTLGRLVRWRHSEIMEWIAAGCPDVSKSPTQPANKDF